jgi:hypothetical protein
VAQRVLLRPKAKTFYSVDALNPDVVHHGKRYLLFFSGNDRTGDSNWRTGVAIAPHPWGPFRVSHRRWKVVNGGTTIYRGRYYQAATAYGVPQPVMFEGSSFATWRPVSTMPLGSEWHSTQADLYLDPRPTRIDAYFLARPPGSPFGGSIGRAHYRNGRWWGFRRLLSPEPGAWDWADLGEPAIFRTSGRTYMLYVGMGDAHLPRQVGLAQLTSRGWRRCSTRPLIPAGRSWYRMNAIDPEPLVSGNRLYVYFGGGERPSLGGDMSGVIGVRVYRLEAASGSRQ